MMISQEIRKRELDNCTFIKTVLMIVVVFFHSIVFWRGEWFDIIEPVHDFQPYKILAKWLQSFHIYGFAWFSQITWC